MALRVTIDALGEDVVSRSLLGITGALEDMTPIWEQLDDELSRASVRQFASQGAYGSAGWQPLAPSTLERKARLGQPNQILQATRRLKRSLTVSDHPEHLFVSNRQHMAWGTTVPYAKHHQDGNGILPRRRVVQLPESARRSVMKTIQRGILTAAGGGR